MKTALVVGFGSIGKRHARILSETFGMAVTVVSQQKGIEFPVVETLDQITNLDSFDYIVICSETVKHYEHLAWISARAQGAPILIEKPLFAKSEVSLPASISPIFVAYNLRFHPVVQELKKQLNDQTVTYVSVLSGYYLPWWRPERPYQESYSAKAARGGGVLLDLSHEIDYFQWLFGDIQEVVAMNRKISDLEIDSDDIATGICLSDRKVLGSFTLDYLSKIDIRQVIVQTHEKTLIADLNLATLQIADKENQQMQLHWDVARDDTYIAMHRDCLGARQDVCTYAEALSGMRTIEMIQTAEKEKHYVSR